MASEFDRRQFLKQTSMSLLALGVSARASSPFHSEISFAEDINALRAKLLDEVNRERAQDGLSSLRLDRLANDVAQLHATEMAENNFLNHWGLDGRKPYHRYAFAGGTDATAENDAAADYSAPFASDDFADAPLRMHKAMYSEVPPNDGHRQTILTPEHTHVGFGLATEGLHVRLCEVYVSRYVNIDPYPTVKPPQSRFVLSGRLLDPKYSLEGIDIFYERLPSRPTRSWLETPRPYGLPENPTASLYLKLPPNKMYDDGTSGTIEIVRPGAFRAPIELSRKEPGIYTLVVWLARSETAKLFPATHVCVRAE
ncbi:MAG TPA: CAP domain-containing protein [Pyrinomonadaceae bacterium]|jgi:uncharacterized protein YkwD|nr:CAP domain-containing protein [Pyrinomonadaceae bacterium]